MGLHGGHEILCGQWNSKVEFGSEGTGKAVL